MNKATQLSSQNNTLNLDIEGMTCAACAARIERVISKQEDVLDVSVSFPLKSAIVDINDVPLDDVASNEDIDDSMSLLEKKVFVIDSLQTAVVDKLYLEYDALTKESNANVGEQNLKN